MALRRKRRPIRRDRAKAIEGFKRGYSASSNGSGVDNDLVDQALAVWQKHADRQLSREDGREIAENLMGFFGLLEEWRFAEQAAEIRKKKSAPSGAGKAAREGKPV